MKKNQNEKCSHFRQWKSGKKWLYSATALALLVGGVFSLNHEFHVDLPVSHVSADVVNATQVGSLNGQPVVKAQSTDMGSSSFQATVDGLLKNANLDGVKYVADNISWQPNTSLNGGVPLSSFGSAARFNLGQDGFLKTDLAVPINVGQNLIVMNVGSITDIVTGEKIPVSMKVMYLGIEHGDDGQTNQNAIIGVRNEGSTITFGAVTPVSGTATSGGQTESGGGAGGAVGDGSLVGFINKIRTNIALVRSDNGQEIPNSDIIMAMKVSDVDANQLIELGANGALGYILSPNSALSVYGGGLRSTSSGASISDSGELTDNSYVVLKRFNSSAMNTTYLDGANNHIDLVWAAFGKLPFKVNVTGTFKLDKSLVSYGDTMPNSHYNLQPIVFDIYDNTGKDVGDIVVPADGKPVESIQLPPAEYTLKERSSSVTSSTGQILNTNTYKVTVVGGKTGDNAPLAKADNQIVKGQIELNKVDKETGTTKGNGKADMASAKYQLFYGEDLASHKKDEPVKWGDVPDKPIELLRGTKVDSYYADGKLVTVGDNIVVDVSDSDMNIGLKGLLLGKYYLKEVDSPVGYTLDKSQIDVEVKWQDNKTINAIMPVVKSTETPIKAKINFQKIAEISGGSASSGFNDVKFNFTPLEGVGKVITAKTGINSNGDDGYGSVVLDYNDYIMEEVPETSPKGYDVIKPIYIHMETDTKRDVVIITASYKKDFSNPFSTHEYYQSDNSGIANENISGSVAGTITSEVPYISLAPLRLTDKETPLPPLPSIDVEKSSETVPQAGQGNNSDKDDNLGKGDADTKATAIKLGNKDQAINFRIANNGAETLTHIKVSDKTIEGKKDVKNIKWTYKDKDLSINKDGEFELDGKLLELQADEFVTAVGTLETLPDGEMHGDEVSVSGIGLTSAKNVSDKDKWYGKLENKPSIDVEKSSENITKSGDGNNSDKDNNLDKGDADTKATAVKLDDKVQTINFRVTNNGTEPLSHIKVTDKTIDGKQDVKNIKWVYQGKALTINKDGEFELDGKLLELPVDGYVEATGTLDKLDGGETHADEATVSGKGAISGKTVGDKDEWYGEKPKAPDTPKPSLPMTGETKAKFAGLAGLILIASVAIFVKRKSIAKLISRFK
mgnify:FL=1